MPHIYFKQCSVSVKEYKLPLIDGKKIPWTELKGLSNSYRSHLDSSGGLFLCIKNLLSKNLLPEPHLKIEPSLQQLVHGRR